MLSADEDYRKGTTERVIGRYEDRMFPAYKDCRKGTTDRVIGRWDGRMFPADKDCRKGTTDRVIGRWDGRMFPADKDCRKGTTVRVIGRYGDLMFPADKDCRKGTTEREIGLWEFLLFPAAEDCRKRIAKMVIGSLDGRILSADKDCRERKAKMVIGRMEDWMLSADKDHLERIAKMMIGRFEDWKLSADKDYRERIAKMVIWSLEDRILFADKDCREMITSLIQHIVRTLLIEYELAWIQKWIITIMITILASLSKLQLGIKVRFKHGKDIKATKLVLWVCGDIERNPGPGNSRSEILRKFRKSQQTRILKMLHGLKGSKEPMHLYKNKPEWWPTDVPFVNVSNHRKENECKECFDTLVDLLLCHKSVIPVDLASILVYFKDLYNSDCKNKQARGNRTREVECKEALVAWMDIKNTEKVLCTTTTPFYDNLRGLLCILKEREKQGEPIPEDIKERCREIALMKSEVLEDTRLSHKDSRLSHENNRLSHEDSRLSYEDGRLSNECSRLSHAGSHLSHKDSSLWHEESRLPHEDGRLSHEDGRLSHEDGRFLHQNSRLSHKDSRLSHGDSRLSSEDIHLSDNNMGKRKHSFKDTEFAASKKPKIESIDIGKMTGSRFPLQEQDILVHKVPVTSPVESSSFEENEEYTKISPDSDNLKDVSDILPNADAIALFMDILDFNQTEGMFLSIQTEEGLTMDTDALLDSFSSGDSAAEQTPLQESDYDL